MHTERTSIFYTAVGHFCRKTDANGRTYPVILVNQEEHMVDMQEMAVWTVLNWRFLHLEQIEMKYGQLAGELPPARRTLETCLNRLEMRGLIARGVGDTDFEALYDLLGGLYVVPSRRACPCGWQRSGSCCWTGCPSPKPVSCSKRTGPVRGRFRCWPCPGRRCCPPPS